MRTPKSLRNRFNDEQRDFFGSVLFHVLYPAGDDPSWDGISPDSRRQYRYRAMSFIVELWKLLRLEDILKQLAPEQPLIVGNRCVHCCRPRASRDPHTHTDDCPWALARTLLGDREVEAKWQ